MNAFTWISRATLPLVGALCLCLCTPLRAESPDTPDSTLAAAQTALANGLKGAALDRGIEALRKNPLGAGENLQVSLTFFWIGQFEDSARYMRRALTADPGVIQGGALAARLPVKDILPRLEALAKLAPEDVEMCFLTGALLLLDKDVRRAQPFLVRAEELAGTDGQAASLLGTIEVSLNVDRNLTRGVRELREALFSESVRSFLSSAADRPAQGSAYMGLALGLAAESDDKMALHFAAIAASRSQPLSLCQWLADARPHAPPLCAAGVRFETPTDDQERATPARQRLAMWLWFSAGYYASAQRCAVALLLDNRQDEFARGLLDFMSSRSLSDDPVKPEEKPVEKPIEKPVEKPAEPTVAPLEECRKFIRKLDYNAALKALEPLVSETQQDAEVFRLLYVVLVGRGELIDAAKAVQTWFLRADDAARVKLRVLRDLFDRDADYDHWKKTLLDARNTDLIAAVPRLLLIATDLSEGRYSQARVNLGVAIRAEQKNPTLLEMNRLLSQNKYQDDAEVPKALEVQDPRVLLGEGERLFRDKKYEEARGKYLAAAEGDATLKDIQLCLFKVNFALGDYERAATALEKMFAAQKVEENGADAFSLPITGAYGDASELDKHLQALNEACKARPLSDKPWLVLGATQYGRRNYAEARDALQRYVENTLSPAKPNAAAMKLLENAKKLAK
ncbi:MAG: hypothetical protein KBG84_08700 [Planctomycetes bacterium]|nr:hypothetical protein [Planctomycetota bacterium]